MGILDSITSSVANLNLKMSEVAESAGLAQVEENAAEADVEFFMQLDEPAVAHVTCDVLNVRSTPSTSEPRIGQLKRGAEISVDALCDDWLRTKYNDSTAYVFGMYTDYEAPEMIVTASSLNIRKAPGTDSDKIGSLANGTTVRVLAETNGWAKILNGKTLGYVSMQYLKKADD